MQPRRIALFSFFIAFPFVSPTGAQLSNLDVAFSPLADALKRSLAPHRLRQSPSDLEVGGDLAKLPPETTGYLTHDELAALPQVTVSVTDDSNFASGTRISGVPLGDLAKLLGASPESEMVVAICDDQYQAAYPRAYLALHRPILVIRVNGQSPAGWPKDAQDHKHDMGPYMISHARFVPAFKVLSHTDEPQIPWGVVRLEFRTEKAVFDSITPRGSRAQDAAVQAGYRIAQQNCFRCHNSGLEGGRKSGLSWEKLAASAVGSPEYFAGYVRNPASKNARAQMPGNPAYDDATIGALRAYFQTFDPAAKP